MNHFNIIVSLSSCIFCHSVHDDTQKNNKHLNLIQILTKSSNCDSNHIFSVLRLSSTRFSDIFLTLLSFIFNLTTIKMFAQLCSRHGFGIALPTVRLGKKNTSASTPIPFFGQISRVSFWVCRQMTPPAGLTCDLHRRSFTG